MVTTLHHKTVILLALCLAIGLSYLSIRTALASHYADLGTLEGYMKATSLEPSNAMYWSQLGDSWQNDLQKADQEQAIQAYRTSISLNSHAAQPWLGLASAYEGEGKVSEARAALLSAKRAYPASADVSWRYANFLIRNGEAESALPQAHEALEREPIRAWEAFALFQHFYPNVDELVDRLLPRQESAYLDVVWGLIREGRSLEALKVWDRLFKLNKEMPPHGVPAGTYQVTQAILFSLVEQLLSQGHVGEANRLWDEALDFMHFSSLHEPRDSLVWDGGFETDLTGGLSWRIDAPSGSAISFSKTIKHSGKRALEVKFDGKHNVDFHGVCQLVPVEPDTTYDFSVWLRTENITTDRGLFLRLGTPQGGKPETFTSELTGTHSWSKVGFRWKVPNNMRLVQICLMRLRSDNLYNTIAGTVWLDDVQLVPIVATSRF
jgi:hypothetical protein